MKIKEVCEKTGLTDRAIRHYIKSGLVFPVCNENYIGRKNYNFSDKDIDRLNQIATLRKYNFSLSDIKLIIDDEHCINKILENHINNMKTQTDNDVKLINELIETSLKKPETLYKLCEVLNSANYSPKQLPSADNQPQYRLLYNRVSSEKKILEVFLALFIIATIVLLGIQAVNSWAISDFVNNIEDYESVLGKGGTYKSNWIGYNNIFPDEIPESADVKRFNYIYYDPYLDGNYLGYLVYTCNDEDYMKEYERLSKIESSENYMIYGTTGFVYELCAIKADRKGMIYALTDRKNKKFIYVSMEFTNGYTDIDYNSVIDKDHLPQGFNAIDEYSRKLYEEAFE